ncbi:hypothetical protein [Bacillus sp. 1006-3]|uniref:hypothetical protein n=1 Tax=unclassified Bacillus (in: firmicutes) TaxID=185979 RepID=UPI001F0F21F9|nr:hypothetical protein [Bacillus sp. 1006-3]MCH4866670.1 hypothetical protein [Bacillus sp. 1006-3]MCY8636501.1 hypothetical protein [Bacillus sp. S17B2]
MRKYFTEVYRVINEKTVELTFVMKSNPQIIPLREVHLQQAKKVAAGGGSDLLKLYEDYEVVNPDKLERYSPYTVMYDHQAIMGLVLLNEGDRLARVIVENSIDGDEITTDINLTLIGIWDGSAVQVHETLSAKDDERLKRILNERAMDLTGLLENVFKAGIFIK